MTPKPQQVWKQNGGHERFVRVVKVQPHRDGAHSVMLETVRKVSGRWVNATYAASWINATRFNGEADGFSLHEDAKS